MRLENDKRDRSFYKNGVETAVNVEDGILRYMRVGQRAAFARGGFRENTVSKQIEGLLKVRKCGNYSEYINSFCKIVWTSTIDHMLYK